MSRYSLYWVLLLFVCVVMVLLFNSSSCYALSYEDIKEYVNYTSDYFPNNSNYQTIKSVINNMNAAQQNSVDNMGSGYENVSIFTFRQSSRTYVNIKVFHCNSLVISNQGITYTGNYKIMQWQNSWGNATGPLNENNSSIDGGYSYDRTAGRENNLMGMCYLGQSPTSRYRISLYFCRKSSNSTIYLFRV